MLHYIFNPHFEQGVSCSLLEKIRQLISFEAQKVQLLLKQRAGCTSISLQTFTRQYYRILKSCALSTAIWLLWCFVVKPSYRNELHGVESNIWSIHRSGEERSQGFLHLHIYYATRRSRPYAFSIARVSTVQTIRNSPYTWAIRSASTSKGCEIEFEAFRYFRRRRWDGNHTMLCNGRFQA